MSEEERIKYDNRERIGEQVRNARNDKNLSIRQLAEISGVPYQNITKIENGKYNVSIDILGKLCHVLGIRLDLN